MKKNLATLLLTAALPVFIFVLPGSAPPETGCLCDPRAMHVNSEIYFNSVPAPAGDISDRIREYQRSASSAEKTFMKKYKEAELAATVGKGVVEANKFKWDGVLETATVATPFLKVGLSKVNEVVHEKLAEAIETDRQQSFKRFLYEVRRTDQQAYQQLIDPNTVIDQNSMQRLLSGSAAFRGIREELEREGKASDFDLLTVQMMEQQKRDIELVNQQSYLRDVVLDNRISDVNKRVIDLDKRFKSFVADQIELNETLIEQGNQIARAMDGITATLDVHSKDLSFLKGVAYNQLSTTQKLEAVKNDIIVVKNKEAALAELRRQEKIEGYMKTTQKILNGANDIATILNNIPGIDPKLVSDVNRAVQAGSAIYQGVTSFMSGNPLGAFTAVSSLFGGGQSPQAAQLGRIEKTVNAIYKLQIEMNQKLDELLVETKRTQDLIVQSTQSLHDALARYHEIVIGKLNNIHAEVLLTQQLLNDYNVDQSINMYWAQMIRLRKVHEIDSIPSYEEFYEEFGEGAGFGIGRFPAFVSAIENIFNTINVHTDGQGLKVHTNLKLRDGPETDDFKTYFMMISSLVLAQRDGYLTNNYSLANPVLSTSAVVEKRSLDYSRLPKTSMSFRINQTIEQEKQKLAIGESSYLATHFFIDPSKLRLYSAVLLNFIQMSNYMKFDGTAYTKATLREVMNLSKNVAMSYYYKYDELWNALELTELAIAQQNLLAGDQLLPYYSSKVISGDIFKPENAQHLATLKVLMTRNPLFGRNFSMYMVREQLIKMKGSPISYKQFFVHRDSIAMRKLLAIDSGYNSPKSRIFTSSKKDGFYWGFDNTTPFKFPEAGELDHDLLEYAPAMEGLLALKQKLFEQILYMQSMVRQSEHPSKAKFKKYDEMLGTELLPESFFKDHQKAITLLK